MSLYIRSFAAIVLLLSSLASVCVAQVLNGDFSAGAVDWTWKQALVGETADPAECANRISPFLPTLSSDVPKDFNNPARGRYANLSGVTTAAVGSWAVCRQIEQQVFLTPGKQLAFDAKLGDNFSSSVGGTIEGVSLEVLVVDPSSGLEVLLVSYFGESKVCTQLSYCNDFSPRLVDISKYWGRSVKLRFRATSRFYRSRSGIYTISSGAYVDSIRFESTTATSWTPPISGSWYDSGRSGHGLHLSRAGNGSITLVWYTYLSDGKPIWYISESAQIVKGVWQASLFKSSWDSSRNSNVLSLVGDVRIEMKSAKAMNFFWDFYALNGSSLEFDGAEPMIFLSGGGSYTGLWYEPSYSGWGLSLEYLDNPNGIDTVATAFYYAGNEPVWAQGAIEGTPTGNKIVQLTEYTGIGLCPECIGQETRMFPWPAGMLALDLDAQRGWIEAQSHSGATWNRGSAALPAEIVRMTGP